MKNFLIISLALMFALACLASLTPGDSNPNNDDHKKIGDPKHTCTVNLNEGQPIKGLFVGADEQSVTIRVAQENRKIMLDDVANIHFRVPHRMREAPSEDSE